MDWSFRYIPLCQWSRERNNQWTCQDQNWIWGLKIPLAVHLMAVFDLAEVVSCLNSIWLADCDGTTITFGDLRWDKWTMGLLCYWKKVIIFGHKWSTYVNSEAGRTKDINWILLPEASKRLKRLWRVARELRYCLVLRDMSPGQKVNVRYFKKPAPVREIGLVTYRHFVKEGLIQALRDAILAAIPSSMKSRNKREVVNL